MNHRTYLITGGVGFLGTNLAKKLLENNHNVIVYDSIRTCNVHNVLKVDGYKVVEGDIRDKKKFLETAKECDGIFHLASQVSHIASQQNPYLDLDVNMKGTLNILEVAKEFSIPIVYASSRSVYGRHLEEELPLTEKSLTQPIDAYGITKLGAEKYILLYNHHYDLPTCALRMANLFGEHQILTSSYQFIAYVFFAIMRNMNFTFYGNPKLAWRDFLFVEDVCDAYMIAMKNIKNVAGEVFNVGGKDYSSWYHAMEIASEITGNEIKCKSIPHTNERVRLENLKSQLSYRKIEEALEWKPTTGLKEGFIKMNDYYLKNDNWKLHLQSE